MTATLTVVLCLCVVASSCANSLCAVAALGDQNALSDALDAVADSRRDHAALQGRAGALRPDVVVSCLFSSFLPLCSVACTARRTTKAPARSTKAWACPCSVGRGRMACALVFHLCALGLIHVAIQFPLYEHLKVRLADADGHLSVPSLITATAVAKTVAVGVSYPHEVVRSRQQHAIASLTAREAFLAVWRVEGLYGFYHGMTTNLLRVVPSCVITFTTYEVVVKSLNRWIEKDDLQ